MGECDEDAGGKEVSEACGETNFDLAYTRFDSLECSAASNDRLTLLFAALKQSCELNGLHKLHCMQNMQVYALPQSAHGSESVRTRQIHRDFLRRASTRTDTTSSRQRLQRQDASSPHHQSQGPQDAYFAVGIAGSVAAIDHASLQLKLRLQSGGWRKSSLRTLCCFAVLVSFCEHEVRRFCRSLCLYMSYVSWFSIQASAPSSRPSP